MWIVVDFAACCPYSLVLYASVFLSNAVWYPCVEVEAVFSSALIVEIFVFRSESATEGDSSPVDELDCAEVCCGTPVRNRRDDEVDAAPSVPPSVLDRASGSHSRFRSLASEYPSPSP